MANLIPLVCGDPDKPGGAAFSRFVYPFAYWLTYEEKNNLQTLFSAKKLCYRDEHSEKCGVAECTKPASDKNFMAREKYFAHETRSVLFKSARWLRVDGDAWINTEWDKGVTILCRGKDLTLCMKPPRVVLFEAENAIQSNIREQDVLQTGFLLVDLYFKDTESEQVVPDLDDLLKINELFRYSRHPYQGHENSFCAVLSNVPVTYHGCADETESVEEKGRYIGSKDQLKLESYSDRWTNMLEFPLIIDGKVFRLEHHEKECPTYADDRTYVWSAAILKKGVDSLPCIAGCGNRSAHNYGHWIRLLNIDSPDETSFLTHKNVSDFEREWARERTYHRWEESGTWYGFNYHSGVMLARPSPDYGPPAVRHFQDMYFDMALLLFYVRVTLFRFSGKLTAITRKNNSENLSEKKTECGKKTENFDCNYSDLRKSFNIFSILYQFPILSNQQQSLEMYAIARKYFDIETLYHEVKEEIDTAHQLEEMGRQRKSDKLLKQLTCYGLVFAIIACLASIFGMNVKNFQIFEKILEWFFQLASIDFVPVRTTVTSFGGILLIVVVLTLIISYALRKKLLALEKEENRS